MKQSLVLILLFLLTKTLNPAGGFTSPGIEGISKLFGRLPKFRFLEFEL